MLTRSWLEKLCINAVCLPSWYSFISWSLFAITVMMIIVNRQQIIDRELYTRCSAHSLHVVDVCLHSVLPVNSVYVCVCVCIVRYHHQLCPLCAVRWYWGRWQLLWLSDQTWAHTRVLHWKGMSSKVRPPMFSLTDWFVKVLQTLAKFDFTVAKSWCSS